MTPDINERRLVPFRFYSEYNSADVKEMTKVDLNWDAIYPEHGLVAMDHSWAADRGLPRSQDLLSDPSKGVYAIESYHSLHCLVVITSSGSFHHN